LWGMTDIGKRKEMTVDLLDELEGLGLCGWGGFEGVEEGAGFGDDVFGFGGGEGPAEDALRRELGATFGVASDELHEDAGVDRRVG
jgi:hypothetical protein